MQKPKVLVLTSTFPRWAGDREPAFVFELSKRLSDRFQIIVLAPHTRGAARRESLQGLTVIRFRYFFSRWEVIAYDGGMLANLSKRPLCAFLLPLFFLSQLICMRRILRRENIAAIHAHWLIPQGLTAAICKTISGRKTPPILCTSHGSDLLALRGRLFKKLKHWTAARCDMLTVVSHALKSEAAVLVEDAAKIEVVSMGVDTGMQFVPHPEQARDTETILYVGRLVQSKAVDVLVRAMSSIRSAFPQVTLQIVGDGPERNSLQQLATDLGVADKVHFAGAIENSSLPERYRKATMLISPSLSEGLSVTLVEALACECPVIASDLPTNREIMIEGVSGVLVPPKNAEELARRAISLLGDPDKRTRLGRAGREAVLVRYSWDTVARRYGDLLEQLTIDHSIPAKVAA